MKLPIMYHDADWQTRRDARNEYIKLQDGKCWHCSAPLSKGAPESITSKRINWKLFPPNFLRWPVHLHHSHETGLTIGAVHAYCNAYLWQYEGQ